MTKISQMTGKLAGLQAINTNTLSNPFCIKMHKKPGTICHECYSFKMLKTYRQSCVRPWESNSQVLSSRELSPDELPRLKAKYIRINAHGAFINYQHVDNVMRIVKSNPDKFFGIWTKRAKLIKDWLAFNDKPINCNLIYSSPVINKRARLPKGFNKVFTVYDKPTGKTDINCGSKSCTDCLVCYSLNNVKQINERIK